MARFLHGVARRSIGGVDRSTGRVDDLRRDRRSTRRGSIAAIVAGLLLGACVRTSTPPGADAPDASPSDEAASPPPLVGHLAGEGDEAPKEPPAKKPEVPEPIVDLVAGSDLKLVHDGLANYVLTAPGVVVILEEDFRHVTAIDAETGAVRWRSEAQTEPNGRHTLYRVGDRILVHAGPKMIALDAANGRRLGEAQAFYNGNDMRCRFVVGEGGCAYQCDCDVGPVTCATGAQLGSFRSAETHLYHDLSQPHDTVCWQPPGLIGGVGELTLIHHNETGDGPEIVAIDPKSTVRWRSSTIGAGLGRIGESGAAGEFCWIGAGGEDLRFFRCADGHPLFNAREKIDGAYHSEVRDLGEGRLWITVGGHKGGAVAVRDAKAGGVIRWRKTLAATTHAMPVGASIATMYLGRPARLLVLDPGTGREVFALDLGESDALLDDRAGGYVRSGDELTELDPRGQVRRRRPRPLTGLWQATPTHFVTHVDTRVEVLRREDLSVALRLDATLAVVDGAPPTPTSLVFLLWRGERAARVVVLR